jgi:hypothetical protein
MFFNAVRIIDFCASIGIGVWHCVFEFELKKIGNCVLPRKQRAHFWFLVIYRAAEKVQYDYLSSASCLIVEFWDFGMIMAAGHWIKRQNRDSQIFSS